MKRSWHIWLGFAPCVAVLLAVMGWISLSALDIEEARSKASRERDIALRHEASARRQAIREEKVRLSLWRIDSVLAPFVAQESARPYFVYGAFLTVDRAYGAMFNDRAGGETLMPSPLLLERPPNVLLHFQLAPDGQVTSPQVPLPMNYNMAVSRYGSKDTIDRTQATLSRIEGLLDRERLLALLPESPPRPAALVVNPLVQNTQQRLQQQMQRRSDLENLGRGAVEYRERNRAMASNTANALGQNEVLNRFNIFSVAETDIRGVLMTPLWIDGQLILARRIAVGGQEYVQGCLLDWPQIKAVLLETIDDLLPEADLASAHRTPPENEALMLAALPVRLIPDADESSTVASTVDNLPQQPGSFPPVTGLSLVIAWACVLLAIVAVGGLLLGVIRLSDRRASFVTAVTHELRTPLTTFQMYAEMLADGMISEPRRQKEYLNTLRTESVRLSHLVENVLSYARLERGRADGRVEAVDLARLIETARDRLAGRAEQAGMQLLVEPDETIEGSVVLVNVSATEQILFNLLDNSCKYASAASDKRINLTLGRNDGAVEVRFRDHGPGVSPAVRRRLFRPFSKSAHEAAHTAPGVGLGLALSRRLARDFGGDLRLDESVVDGACFVLTLPVQ